MYGHFNEYGEVHQGKEYQDTKKENEYVPFFLQGIGHKGNHGYTAAQTYDSKA